MCNKWRVAVAIAVRWFSPHLSGLNDYEIQQHCQIKFLSAPAGQALFVFLRQQQWATSTTLQLESLIIIGLITLGLQNSKHCTARQPNKGRGGAKSAKRSVPGIELGTSSTLRKNHTTRPNRHVLRDSYLSIKRVFSNHVSDDLSALCPARHTAASSFINSQTIYM